MKTKLTEIAQILNANAVYGKNQMEREITQVFASDLLSDVLPEKSGNLLPHKGLTNIQAIRTSEMADATNSSLVRNKKASEELMRQVEEYRPLMYSKT
jgi:hypothetical protein